MKKFVCNNKRILLLIGICLVVIIISILLFIIFYKEHNVPITYKEYTGYLNNFSIKVNENFEFDKLEENPEYELILESQKFNSSIYVSSFDSTSVRSIETVINSDKDDFSSKFENVSDISDITSLEISEYNVYEYHFTSNNKYIQVYYILADDKAYVLDFYIDINKNYEYNLKDSTKEIISSFKILDTKQEENK